MEGVGTVERRRPTVDLRELSVPARPYTEITWCNWVLFEPLFAFGRGEISWSPSRVERQFYVRVSSACSIIFPKKRADDAKLTVINFNSSFCINIYSDDSGKFSFLTLPSLVLYPFLSKFIFGKGKKHSFLLDRGQLYFSLKNIHKCT